MLYVNYEKLLYLIFLKFGTNLSLPARIKIYSMFCVNYEKLRLVRYFKFTVKFFMPACVQLFKIFFVITVTGV